MNVSRSVSVLLVGLSLASALAFGQSAPSAAATPLSPSAAASTIAPPVDTTNLPAHLVIAGAGVHAGQTAGFTNLLMHAGGPVYAALAEDVTAGKTSTRVGLETIVFRQSGLYVSLKGNAGVATASTATGGSYGVGGSVLFDLAKVKLPGYVLAFSGTWDYSNIADIITQANSGNARQIFSGGTYRFGIGRTF